MADDQGRKPDYRLKVLNKKTDQKATVGAAWANEDGSISIVLDYLVSIPSDNSHVLTLFPVTEVLQDGRRVAKHKPLRVVE